MLTNKQKKDLIGMGYREMFPGKWGKPIGYNLLTFTEKTMIWDNWFMNTKNEHTLWDSKPYTIEDHEDELIDWIKVVECYTRTDINMTSNFQFITLKEQTEIEL